MARLSEISEKAKNRTLYGKHPSTMTGLDSIIPKFSPDHQYENEKDELLSIKETKNIPSEKISQKEECFPILNTNNTKQCLPNKQLQQAKPLNERRASESEALQKLKPFSERSASVNEGLQQVKASIFNLVGISLSYEVAATINEAEKLFLAIIHMASKKINSKAVRVSREEFIKLGLNRARVTQTRDALIDKGLLNTQLIKDKNRDYMEYELNF